MLLWMEGFDVYGSGLTGVGNMEDGLYSNILGQVGTALSEPTTFRVRTGTYAFQLSSGTGGQGFRRIFGADKSTIGFGYAAYIETLPLTDGGMVLANFLNNAAQDICSVTVSTTGQFQVRTGAINGTIRATSAPVLVPGAFQHIEMKVHFNNTTGSVEIRLNGATVVNASGINLDAQGAGLAAQVRVGQGVANADWSIDDMFLWDTSGSYNNDFIGDKKVYTLFPSADTAVADWTPDTGGVGFSRINEATPADASYIQGNDPGDVSEFEVQDLPANVSAISAVMSQSRMYKTDAGTSNVQISLLSGAAAADGADRPMTTAATYWCDVFEEDPDTSSAWTKIGVDAMLVRTTRTL